MRKSLLLLPEEQRKSCCTPKSKGIDNYLGKIFLAFETFLNGIASYCSIQTSEKVRFERQPFISVFLLCLCVFLPVAMCPIPVVFAPLDFTCSV